MTKLSRAILIALASTLIAGHASAVPVYFTDRTSFNAAAGALANFESFETLPPEIIAPSVSAPTISFPNITLTQTGGVNAFTCTIVNSIFSAATTDGSHSV